MYNAARIAKTNMSNHDFRVGVYLETDSYGLTYGNVAHDNSRLTMCAETLALIVAKGSKLEPKHMHLTTDSEDIVFPCGMCRQYMSEWPKLKITIYNCDGTKKITKTVNQLLHNPFKRDRIQNGKKQ